MGYYTTYTVVTDPILKALDKELKEVSGYNFYQGDSQDPIKWYDYKNHMLQISRHWPWIHFTVHGVGEENGDVWRHHFLSGKHIRYDQEWHIPPFNEEDLK